MIVRSRTTISCARPITPRISHRRRSQPPPAVVASDITITTSFSVITACARKHPLTWCCCSHSAPPPGSACRCGVRLAHGEVRRHRLISVIEPPAQRRARRPRLSLLLGRSPEGAPLVLGGTAPRARCDPVVQRPSQRTCCQRDESPGFGDDLSLAWRKAWVRRNGSHYRQRVRKTTSRKAEI